MGIVARDHELRGGKPSPLPSPRERGETQHSCEGEEVVKRDCFVVIKGGATGESEIAPRNDIAQRRAQGERGGESAEIVAGGPE